MNTIRRPRAHPRKASVNFKTLGWLLIREAALRIIYGSDQPTIGAFGYRWFTEGSAHDVRARVALALRLYPHRRYYP